MKALSLLFGEPPWRVGERCWALRL